MKKNILSLVAFMAFSVSAFANTVEVKEEKQLMILGQLNCESIHYNTYWTWRSGGASHDDSIKKADEAKSSCNEMNKKDAESNGTKKPEIIMSA